MHICSHYTPGNILSVGISSGSYRLTRHDLCQLLQEALGHILPRLGVLENFDLVLDTRHGAIIVVAT